MGIVVVLAGLAVGSFLNVCIDRLPARRSLLRPRSHCDACNTPLAARDLIPVVSYALLRGRCRRCSTPISLRIPLVEAGSALAFFAWWWYLGESLQTALGAATTCVLIVAAVTGVEHCPSLNRLRRTGHDN
ncbi:MAG TPA: prepilin peptidase [Dehalococcoidia bacterium]|nr:prepilin peptidase [Dehalococcoidia bacterium]